MPTDEPRWWRRILDLVRKNPDRILLLSTLLVDASQFVADMQGSGLGS